MNDAVLVYEFRFEWNAIFISGSNLKYRSCNEPKWVKWVLDSMKINKILKIADLKKNKQILRNKQIERLNIEKFRWLRQFIIKFAKEIYKKFK